MTQRDINKIDKTILDNFYKLVHIQPNLRLKAAASTYKILESMKKKNLPKFNENLNYIVDRLVTGLSSSRGLARQGYATLLLELLRANQLSTDRLLSIANTKFGRINKETSRDNLLGYYLLITIILESGNHKKSKSNEQQIEKIYKILTQLINTKSYLDHPTCNLLIQHHSIFHPYIVDDIPQHAFGSDSRLSIKDILSILLSNKKEPNRELAKLDNVGLMNLFSPLTDEKLLRQPIHPIFIEASLYIVSHRPQLFSNFYSTIIHPTFFRANHNELASMGLKYTSSMIRLVENVDIIKILLSEHVVKTLILSLRNRTPLYKHAVDFFNTVKDLFTLLSDSEDVDKTLRNEKQYTILLKLTTNPGSITFDEDSKSMSINNLLGSSCPSVLKKYCLRLVTVLHKIPSQSDRVQVQHSCARQIVHILRRTQLNDEKQFTCRILKFLLMTSLFEFPNLEVKEDSFWVEESIPKPIRRFDTPAMNSFRNSYHNGLEHMISICSSSERIEQLRELIIFSDKLMKLNSAHNKTDQTDESLHLSSKWSVYMSIMAKQDKLIKKHQDSKLLYSITTLFLFYGLQIIEYGFDCSTQLEELEQSTLEALKADPADGSWADILTDQIIAILSATECKPWIRTLCVSVFGCLLPHISPTSIDLLCDALKTICDDENEDDDEEGDAEESYDSDQDSDVHSTGDHDSDEDQDDEDDLEEDDDARDTDPIIKDAKVSDADEGVVDDEEEEEFLDDEQMMKLDNVIVDMFKLNRVNKKKTDSEFKLRCLDLIKKIILKRHSDTETMDTILRTIIPLANSSGKLQETRPIRTKVINILSKMPGRNSNPKVVAFLSKHSTSKKSKTNKSDELKTDGLVN